MADEVSQVVEIEFKGVYYLLKGTKAFIAYAADFIKAVSEWHHNKYLNRPGSCTWQKIQEVSEGNALTVKYPKELMEKNIPVLGKDGNIAYYKSAFDELVEKYDLRYCVMPDLSQNSEYVVVGIPSQDFALHSDLIEVAMKKRKESQEQADSIYDEKIVDKEQEIANAKTDEEKRQAEIELEKLKDAKKQNQEMLKETVETMDQGNIMEFAEYLQMGEDTDMAKDASLGLEEANSCGVVREYSPYECMWPIRDEGLVPESKEIYYSQRTEDNKLYSVVRTFNTDEDGLVYSEYKVTNPDEPGKVLFFSDRDFTNKEWNEVIKKILKESGMLEDAPTCAMKSKDRYQSYVSILDENFKNASEISSEVPSNEKAGEFIDEAAKEYSQAKSYIDSLSTVVTVPSAKVMPDDERVLCLELEDGLVKGVELVSMNDKEARIKIKDDAVYGYSKPDGSESKVDGLEVITSISELKDFVAKSKGEEMKTTPAVRK